MTKEFRPVPPRTVGRNGGRPKGAISKVKRELQHVAQKYTSGALKELQRIMLNSENDSARVAAAKELLDRGHGKAVQPTTNDTKVTTHMVVEAPPPIDSVEEWEAKYRH